MFVIEFERYLIRLRLTRPARFHFNHGGVLMGLLCRAMRTHELHAGVMPFACESGRVHFNAGDPYHFGLTLAGGARHSTNLQAFREELARTGARLPDPHSPQPTLAGNFEIVSIDPVPPPDLNAALDRLRNAASVSLRLISPFRLERPAALKAKGAGFLNSDCFPPAHFLQRLATRLFLLAHERYPQPHEREELLAQFAQTDDLTIEPKNLLWLDIPLEGAPGKRAAQPKGYTLGGVVGKVTMSGLPQHWLAPLVMGQYAHAGEGTHYGLGRYAIEECAPAQPEAFRPARTLFESLLDPVVLQDALTHVVSHSTAAGVDGYAPDDYAVTGDLLAAKVADELRAGSYQPAPLLGFVASKDGARLRPLTVPTVRDRMAQRAACALLSPAIETLLEDCSYAYRKGFSRAGAARAIERAYEDGYRYVLDADIESFFDAVEWERMFAKLEALFPHEPLVALVEEWIRAPVVFEGRRIERERGLPQGVPVAPLLANFYLDEFDEELLGRDYRLVRYGDDFVVLCKDLATARQAREDARLKLADLGLSLSEEKTAVRSFDEGFNYLGYLFCRALVLESKEAPAGFDSEAGAGVVPTASWLAQVPLERVRALARQQSGAIRLPTIGSSGRTQAVEIVPLQSPQSSQVNQTAGAAKRALYVTTFDTTLRREGETLIVCSPGQEPLTLRPAELSHVVCYGNARVTVPVLLALNEQGVPTYFCRRSGELKAIFGAPPADWQLWMQQAAYAANEGARVDFAREVVAAKLHNFAELCVRFKLARAAEAASELRVLESSCTNKPTLEALNGLEGRGAAVYFTAVGETLDAEWNFEGRRTRPPADPVNAMLSFGYTLLYHHISTALMIAGLNPRIGLYHTERGTYHALACDLQEEFRHLVDAHVRALVNRREVRPEDFYSSEDGRFPFLMRDETRRKFIAVFEQRLSAEFTGPEGETTTYRAFIERQARQVRDLVNGKVTRYRPLRARNR